jgi:hypothetical protein
MWRGAFSFNPALPEARLNRDRQEVAFRARPAFCDGK